MLDDFGDFGEECIYNSWNPNHNTFTSACGNACRCKSSTILTSVLGNLEQKETIAVISFLGQLESHIHRSYIGYNICWKMLKTAQEKNHVLNGFTSLTGLVEWKTHLYAYMRRRILLLGHFGLCQPSPMDFLFTKLHSFTYHHHTCREFSLQGVEDIYIYIQRLYDVWTIYWLGCSNHAPSKPIYLYLPILPYIYICIYSVFLQVNYLEIHRLLCIKNICIYIYIYQHQIVFWTPPHPYLCEGSSASAMFFDRLKECHLQPFPAFRILILLPRLLVNMTFSIRFDLHQTAKPHPQRIVAQYLSHIYFSWQLNP